MKAFLSRAIFSLFLGLALALPAEGQDTMARPRPGLIRRVGDSLLAQAMVPVAPKPMSWKAWAIPAGLIGYGSLSVSSGWFDEVNLFGKTWATDNEDPDRKTRIDDLTQYVPAAAVYGLQIAGVRGRSNFVDATMMYALSNAISNSIVVPLKRWTAQQRPDSSDGLSFPSGHTATAFVSAEFLRQEYKDVSPWIGAGGYAVAILTGYLRMYNNKHWFSDVAAGAGIGIVSTRVSYWLYPKLKNAVLGKQAPSSTVLVPVYGQGGVGLCLVHRF